MKRRMVLHLQREPICDAVRDCTEGNTQAGANIAIEFYLGLSCVRQSSVLRSVGYHSNRNVSEIDVHV